MSRSRTTHVVTQQDIADHCGVHITTVSMALRNHPRLRTETIERIQAVAKQLGYDPLYFDAARRLVLRRHGLDVANKVIGVIFPPGFLNATFFSRMYHGVVSVLTHAGYGALTFCVPFNILPSSQDNTLPFAISRGDVDGLIVFGSYRGLYPVCELLRRTAGFGDRPIVTLKTIVPGCSSVHVDDGKAAFQLTRHLLELGHRDILFMLYYGNPGHQELAPRILSTRNAMMAYGLDPEQHLHQIQTPLCWLDPNFPLHESGSTSLDPESTDRALLNYLDAHPEITAIQAVNDASARQIWHTLEQNGRQIPRDMSIVGFDDTDAVIDASGANQLTTVHVPLREMGEKSAQLMLDYLQGTDQAEQDIMLTGDLLLRHSTAPPLPHR
ncbi:MAG TPA: LacI family DNA-binding transcriptional regulator [Armatimonadota bacterium]